MEGEDDLVGYDEKARAQVAALIEGERRLLAQRRQMLEDCDCKEGMFPNPDRRRLLFAGGALAALAAAAATPATAEPHRAPPGAVWRDVPEDPTKVPGTPIGEDGGYGTRSQFETEVRLRAATPTALSSWSMSPLEKNVGIVTPSGLHFERHHAGIPTIDPARHSLIIHGMVERPKQYTVADVKRFPSISRVHFIECSGNGLTEWRKPTMKTVQGTHGLLSNSEWTGVQFATFAREVGLKDGAQWVLAEGADAAVMTRSIPLEKLLTDGFIAYGQNGEALRPEQGYPLRLILPGWEGNTHIKWLRRLEVSDKPFMTREETSKYTDLLGNGKARQFTFTMEAKSVITFPSGEMKLPGPGFYEVTGLAWSGRGRVARVEVSSDGGRNWSLAGLQEPILPIAVTRFRFPWFWDGKEAVLQSRVTDETGYIQPTLKQLVDIRGLAGPFGSTYHLNAIQSWAVAPDGSVSNVHA
ncbi:MAG TPA: sulfite dehydrogenase [Stellaceae bacterium]|jgi:sulfane dehydrogenase subunit SoxC|nr:sulfite dehydrogenase [Stellaceae bacterium]